MSGARDAAGNLMDAVSWTFTTSATASSCPCTIWPGSATPAGIDPDTSAVELGVKFRTDTPGYITGIRYYRPSQATGTHVGSLWSATGTRLGQVTFAGGTASGWQEAIFSSPVAVTANTTYVASYFTPSRYVVNSGYFASAGTTRGPLTALRNGTDGGNGLYRYTSTPSTFPNLSYGSENYWVDVIFQEESNDTTPPTLEGSRPGIECHRRPGVGPAPGDLQRVGHGVDRGDGAARPRRPGGAVHHRLRRRHPHGHPDAQRRPRLVHVVHRGGQRRP